MTNKREPTAEDIADIERLASEGKGIKAVAALLPVRYKAIVRWMRDHPEVKEAFRRGKAKAEVWLVDRLKDGIEKGQYVPAMFLLKCQHGYSEAGQTDGAVNVQITLPGAMRRDQYEDAVIVKPKQITDGGDDAED